MDALAVRLCTSRHRARSGLSPVRFRPCRAHYEKGRLIPSRPFLLEKLLALFQKKFPIQKQSPRRSAIQTYLRGFLALLSQFEQTTCSGRTDLYRRPVENENVYRRHSNCRCTVEYDPGGAKRFQNVHNKEWRTAEERGKIKTEEAAPYQRPNVQIVKNSELPNGLPIKGEPGSVVDKVDDFGNVLQRREYGENGLASTDFDTSDHGQLHRHPTGAHKHIFDYQKKRPRGAPFALTEQELSENADIIQRGVNYRDPE